MITRPHWRSVVLQITAPDGEAWSATAGEIADANDDGALLFALQEVAEGRIADARFGGGAAPLFIVSAVRR